MTLDSTINDSADDYSNKNVAERDPKGYSLVSTKTSDGNESKITDTDTNKGNYPHKLFTNREIPAIVQVVIPLVDQRTADGVATSGRTFHTVCDILHKEDATGATRRAAGVLKDPPAVN